MPVHLMKGELLELLPALRRFSYSLTNSIHDADDLVQATIERILSKGLPEGVELARWAFTVCRNLWIDEYRARRTRQNAEWSPELRETDLVDGDKDVHAQMELARVSQAMNQLPKDQHMVLSMVAVQGLSYQGVAEALDIPVGTVMSRLSRARTKLVELMNSGASGQTEGKA